MGRFLNRVFLRLSNMVWHHHHLHYGRGFNKQTKLWGPRERLRVQQREKVFPCFCFFFRFVCIFVTFSVSGQTCSIKSYKTQNVSDKVKQATRKTSGQKEGRLTGLQRHVKGFGNHNAIHQENLNLPGNAQLYSGFMQQDTSKSTSKW